MSYWAALGMTIYMGFMVISYSVTEAGDKVAAAVKCEVKKCG